MRASPTRRCAAFWLVSAQIVARTTQFFVAEQRSGPNPREESLARTQGTNARNRYVTNSTRCTAPCIT